MNVDFRHDPNAMGPAGMALLLAGVFSVAVSLAWHASVSADIERVEAGAADLKRMKRRTPHTLAESARDAPETQQEVRVANIVVHQMTVPWDRLFRELESSADDAVALLAVQPDLRNRQVRISGEAKSLKEMLAYSRRLEASGMLGEVVLVGHEVRMHDPQRPVAFSMTAGWSELP